MFAWLKAAMAFLTRISARTGSIGTAAQAAFPVLAIRSMRAAAIRDSPRTLLLTLLPADGDTGPAADRGLADADTDSRIDLHMLVDAHGAGESKGMLTFECAPVAGERDAIRRRAIATRAS